MTERGRHECYNYSSHEKNTRWVQFAVMLMITPDGHARLFLVSTSKNSNRKSAIIRELIFTCKLRLRCGTPMAHTVTVHVCSTPSMV